MRCVKCDSERQPGDFYASNKTQCKVCVRAQVAARRNANIEQIRAYDKQRATSPERVAARKAYAKTPEGRASHRRALRASAARYPERSAARSLFWSAVLTGRIKQWPVCAVPTCSGKPEGHHPDYSQPLSVVWLCSGHHHEAHKITESE